MASNITGFKDVTATPRTTRAKIDSSKEQINSLIEKADSLLEMQLDKLVDTLADSNPDAYKRWKVARKLVNTQTTHTQLKALALDKADDMPLNGAAVSLVGTNSYSTQTDIKGAALLKPIDNGKYLLRVEAPGYQPFEAKGFKIVKGRINKVTAKLEKVESGGE